MACLKLTYLDKPPTLSVVKSIFFSEEKKEAGIYRYGVKGMEKDDNIKVVVNSYDYGSRLLDARLGRLLSMDALSSK